MTKKTRRGWGSITRRNGKLYARFRHPVTGKATWRTLKSTLMRDAETELQQLRERVEAEAAGAGASGVVPMTFKRWCSERYLGILASSVAPSTLESVGCHFDRLCDWFAENGDPLMRDVTKLHAQLFVAWMSERYAKSYTSRVCRSIRSAWRDGIEHGQATINPWDNLKVKPGKPPKVPWTSPRDVQIILDRASEFQRPMLRLISQTGLRVGEAQALCWSDIDLVDEESMDQMSSVYVSDGKTEGAERTVELRPCTAAMLRAMRPAAARAPRAEGCVRPGRHAAAEGPRPQASLRLASRASWRARSDSR
jgi:integrase